jgi:hypothetical protein
MNENAQTEIPVNGNGAAAETAQPQGEPNYGGKESRRRVYALLEEVWGPSRHAQILGLITVRNNARDPEKVPPVTMIGTQNRILALCATIWGAPENIVESLQKIYHGATPAHTLARTASDEELKSAYKRGRADLEKEIEFAERISAIRARYSDFDEVWRRVRPLVPRTVLEEMAEHPDGLDSAYQLSKLPELCQELSELEPEKARERFQHFVRDLKAITRGAQ